MWQKSTISFRNNYISSNRLTRRKGVPDSAVVDYRYASPGVTDCVFGLDHTHQEHGDYRMGGQTKCGLLFCDINKPVSTAIQWVSFLSPSKTSGDSHLFITTILFSLSKNFPLFLKESQNRGDKVHGNARSVTKSRSQGRAADRGRRR
jgi:hypothetical protein